MHQLLSKFHNFHSLQGVNLFPLLTFFYFFFLVFGTWELFVFLGVGWWFLKKKNTDDLFEFAFCSAVSCYVQINIRRIQEYYLG